MRRGARYRHCCAGPRAGGEYVYLSRICPGIGSMAGLGIAVDIFRGHTAERPHVRRDLPHFMVVQNPPAGRHFGARNALADHQK
jgi:hypothetical protein